MSTTSIDPILCVNLEYDLYSTVATIGEFTKSRGQTAMDHDLEESASEEGTIRSFPGWCVRILTRFCMRLKKYERINESVGNEELVWVSDLIDNVDRKWKADLINSTFSEEVATRILQTSLTQKAHDDLLAKSSSGVVAKNSLGEIIASKSVLHTGVVSTFAAEGHACLQALLLGMQLRLRAVEVEGDARTIIKKWKITWKEEFQTSLLRPWDKEDQENLTERDVVEGSERDNSNL
ncbi:hypothetical protein Godav_017527 [Gossypium davidsonii]|uniref:RNase H type-1 domain-containing protein n=1 Tax=Gossypium davidsonii TaxID=34287 RepID=A0A7J8QTL6_GOSDV|nr:hypothetical protein [Gossypium davidsonii]